MPLNRTPSGMKATDIARRRPGVMFAPALWTVRALWNEQPPAGSGHGTGVDAASGWAWNTAPRSGPRSTGAVRPSTWLPGTKYRHPFSSVASSSATQIVHA